MTPPAALNEPPAATGDVAVESYIASSHWLAGFRALLPVLIGIALAVVIFTWVVPGMNGYKQDILANCGIAVILAVSLTVVNGFTGQFSIGHSGFMSLGGYAAASVAYYGTFHFFHDANFHGGLLSYIGRRQDFTGPLIGRGELVFAAALLCGAVVSGVVGWIVGLPSLRLRGDYLAIVTLGFCEIVRILLQQTPQQLGFRPTDPDEVEAGMKYLGDGSLLGQMTHLGGALGMGQVPAYATVFWITLAAVVTILLTVRLKYSAYGRALLSIREDDVAASAVGVNVTKLKVRAFVFSAFFAGLAGGLYALHGGTISAGELGFQRSFDFVIMVVLGGMGSISGAAIAAIMLTLLPEWLRDPPGLWPWGWAGASVIAILILFRNRRPIRPLIFLLVLCLFWDGLVRLFLWLPNHGYPDEKLSNYRLVLYALMLIVVMIVRPQGLFGIHEIWDYLPAALRRQKLGGKS